RSGGQSSCGSKNRDGDRDGAGKGIDVERRCSRSEQDVSPDDRGGCANAGAEFCVGNVFRSGRRAWAEGFERRTARIFQIVERATDCDADRRLENIFAVDAGEYDGAGIVGAVCGGGFCVQRQRDEGGKGDSAAVEAVRDRDGPKPGRGAWTGVRRKIFSARGEGTCAGDGAQPDGGAATGYPHAELDGLRDANAGDREAASVWSKDRIPGQVAQL